MYILLTLYKFLEPKSRFILKVYFDVRDGFSDSNLSRTIETPL